MEQSPARFLYTGQVSDFSEEAIEKTLVVVDLLLAAECGSGNHF